MQPSDIIAFFALIVAGYGAVLSSYLALREIRKDRRRITVIIEYVTWELRSQITITNVGYRPITITEIEMEVNMKQNGKDHWESVPKNALFAQNNVEQSVPAFPKRAGHGEFPVTLEDGDPVTLPLSDEVFRHIFLENGAVIKPRVSVYDIEGHVYRKFRMRLYDTKWGYYKSI